MAAVREMETAPLSGGKRTQDRVLSNGNAAWEAGLALGKHAIQTRHVFHDLSRDLLNWSSTWQHSLGRLSPMRQVPEPGRDKPRQSLLAAITFTARLPFRNSTLKILYCAQICQVQVIKNFGGAPLSFWMARKVINIHSGNCIGKRLLKLS
jgi:hypothetical protein